MKDFNGLVEEITLFMFCLSLVVIGMVGGWQLKSITLNHSEMAEDFEVRVSSIDMMDGESHYTVTFIRDSKGYNWVVDSRTGEARKL